MSDVMNNLSNREDFNGNKDLYKFTLNDHINNLADLVDRMSGFIDHYKNTVGFDGYENEVEELLEDSKNELDRSYDYQNIIEASASKVVLYDEVEAGEVRNLDLPVLEPLEPFDSPKRVSAEYKFRVVKPCEIAVDDRTELTLDEVKAFLKERSSDIYNMQVDDFKCDESGRFKTYSFTVSGLLRVEYDEEVISPDDRAWELVGDKDWSVFADLSGNADVQFDIVSRDIGGGRDYGEREYSRGDDDRKGGDDGVGIAIPVPCVRETKNPKKRERGLEM